MARTPQSIEVQKRKMGLAEGVNSHKPELSARLAKRRMTIDEVREGIPSLGTVKHKHVHAKRRMSIEDVRSLVGVEKPKRSADAPPPPRVKTPEIVDEDPIGANAPDAPPPPRKKAKKAAKSK